MLTCTGKLGETIVIDDKVQITLLGIRDNKVLLGFDSLNKVCIHRKKTRLLLQSECLKLSQYLSLRTLSQPED
ncbi:MAG: carbon storage regulator [Legionella sp.]|nr:carbon storage regulator [Legionella sp.]